jgi:hypothetical protein
MWYCRSDEQLGDQIQIVRIDVVPIRRRDRAERVGLLLDEAALDVQRDVPSDAHVDATDLGQRGGSDRLVEGRPRDVLQVRSLLR